MAYALAAPGDLDSSFDGDGVSEPGTGALLGAAVQPDGKLVAVGSFGPNLTVIRLLADGRPDPSFDGDGKFIGPFGTAHGVVIQPDGKIVIAATSSGAMLALRLNPNGTPDSGFSGDGMAGAFGGRAGQGRAVALQGSDVVLAGSALPAPGGSDGYERLAVARFNADGSPDGSFGPAGTRLFGFVLIAIANAVEIDGDGRIVLAGSHRNDRQTTEALVVRLTPSGDLDSSFDGDGVYARQLARGAAFSAITDLEIDPINRPVMAAAAPNGSSDPEGANAIALRLNVDGTHDNSFSGDGLAYIGATSSKDQYNNLQHPYPGAQGLVLGGNDIILGGYFDEETVKRIAVWALRPDGSLDPSFGEGGRSLTVIEDDSAQLDALAIAPDGELFGVGDLGIFYSSFRPGVVVNLSGIGPPAPPPGPTPGPPGPGPPGPEPPGPEPPVRTCFGLQATIVGTPGRDVLRGTPGREVIVGLGGADTIIARAGNDLVCGGGGNDRIYLQGGNDRASGDGGADLLAGSFGADVLLGRNGRDRLFGAQGPDKLFGGPGPDVLFGGKGRDLLRGGGGRDSLSGGAGEDDSRQ